MFPTNYLTINCYVTQQSFHYIFDNAFTVCLFSLRFATNIHAKIKVIRPINILWVKGNLQINQMCKTFIKTGKIKKSDNFFVFDSDLEYGMLCLNEYINFILCINWTDSVISKWKFLLNSIILREFYTTTNTLRSLFLLWCK